MFMSVLDGLTSRRFKVKTWPSDETNLTYVEFAPRQVGFSSIGASVVAASPSPFTLSPFMMFSAIVARMGGFNEFKILTQFCCQMNMEDEANLNATIEIRRRSASVSDDYSVQKTNDDATESKYSAVKVGYWEDPFLKSFVVNPDSIHRRAPEILRGYWARYAAFELLLNKALEEAGPQAQIISLGSGFDTLYYRLREKKAQFSKLVEIDFSSVTARKIKMISKCQFLSQYFQTPAHEEHHSDLHAGDYHLIGADLRQHKELWAKFENVGLNPALPTIVIAECVLIYMDQLRCDDLLSSLARQFENCVFINYEQVNMIDKFSSVMQNSLSERGIHLPGMSVCESLETQKNRFLQAGFSRVASWTMQDLYENHFNKADVARIESLEMLDERELLSQLLEHYCVVVAVKASTCENLYSLVHSSVMANPMNKWRVDLSGGSGRSVTRTHDSSLNPPGFTPGFTQGSQHVERSQQDQQQQHLMSKRAWDMALQPIKSMPMNMLMLYMSGNTISIFPIMMVAMMGWRPIKAVMAVNAAFKPLELEYAGSLILHKIIFALGNLAGIALAIYKCHTMGLLPNHASDWLDFVPPAERMQFVFSGDSFV
ncbi:ER membrane protein complex subunit 4 [Aphelenchoides bicaudatus]|nr:ER membrane protein complex subunit 4 [Aphelenchoides bicaudatus]